MLVRKALGAVILALEKHLAGKPRRVLNVGTRSTPAGNKTFFGDLFNSSFDGDFGNVIELAELNDGGKLVARFKSAILDSFDEYLQLSLRIWESLNLLSDIYQYASKYNP